VIVRRNDGLGIRTGLRFAILKFKGKVFPVHAVKAERGKSIAPL
jgi:hypothetical protein